VLSSAKPLSRLIDDKGCDANRLRSRLKADGSMPSFQDDAIASVRSVMM
jgi:hypothetical protein